jgi:hypothetical protein
MAIQMSTISSIIHWSSIVLPYSNTIAITLTESGMPLYKSLYRNCIDFFAIKDEAIRKKIDGQICTSRDHYHKIFFDTIAYFGIMLNICKNAIQHGYIEGIFSGVNLVFWSMLITNMFLRSTIHRITHALQLTSPIMYLMVGICCIAALVTITYYTEIWIHRLTKPIIIDPEVKEPAKKNTPI